MRKDESQDANRIAASRRGFLKAGAGLGAMAAVGLAFDPSRTDAEAAVPAQEPFPLRDIPSPSARKAMPH